MRGGAAESKDTCPSCGREAASLSTGHCLFCLQPLAGGAQRVETAKILRLTEFDRARGQMRRSRGRRAARSAGAGLVGVMAGAILIGLFYLAMQWLMGFFGKGTAWRE